MESTRPIRALMRGLDALTVLNLRNGATVSEVAHEIRLPRTTVYRILETLCNAGYVFRDASDDRYRLTVMVRALSGGFDDDAWVSEIARPAIHELSGEIGWPVSIATLSGSTMMMRETTDHMSGFAVERHSAGFRAPLLTTAPGQAYLAFCPSSQREALIGNLAPAQRAELEQLLNEVRAQGFATVSRTRRNVEEIAVSVPVMLHERVPACLSVRFAASAVPPKAGLESFAPKLRQCAAKISTALLEQRVEA
jgi:IclR family mhp operon transcriptional activator